MLGTVLTLWNVLLTQDSVPDDVESLGRWVSGLFRIIQQPVAEDSTAVNSESAEDQSVPSSSGDDDDDSRVSTTERRAAGSDHAVEPVSVKEIRAVFEEMKTSDSNPFSSTASIASHCSSSTVQSVSSSHNHSPLDSTGSLSNQSVESQPSEPISFNTDDGGSPKETYLEGIEKRMMERFGDKFADVVCWLGRYIEQDEEQQILANACNPFLAKLRLRHKIEMIARLEQSADDKERDILTLKEKLAAKEASRDNVQDKYRGRLIRNAEDARRASDDQKRIDKECGNLQSRINKLEKELIEIMDTIDSMHQEIQMDYEKFEYLSSVNSNGVNHQPQTPPVREQTANKDQDNLPEWTKTAKAKKEAWKTLSKEL